MEDTTVQIHGSSVDDTATPVTETASAGPPPVDHAPTLGFETILDTTPTHTTHTLPLKVGRDPSLLVSTLDYVPTGLRERTFVLKSDLLPFHLPSPVLTYAILHQTSTTHGRDVTTQLVISRKKTG